ncbi:MAG TPA: glycosyl hydrolase 115 family protein [Rhodanobacteraceae bacterium]|nr:glycosyl hydrolase 115 family protein [Rhodanobacteraceae bacterium]
MTGPPFPASRRRFLELCADALGAALLPAHGLATTDAAEGRADVISHATPGSVPLIRRGQPAAVLADPDELPGVLRAARDLRSDLSRVAGTRAIFTCGPATGTPAIIAGTLGHSRRVERIIRARGIDTHGVAGRWEACLLQVVEHPEPGVPRALLIAGADQRGTIYGLYEVSRRIGVSPWTWWADVPVARHDDLYAAPGRWIDAPAVRWRGIFLNDEDPCLGEWMTARFGGPNHAAYVHLFELILRLKGNLLWPAMWGNRAFDVDDPLNPALADCYGVVMGTSHVEPMMRAHAEWQRYGHGPWNYATNAKALRAFWRGGIERMGRRESIVTIGMRGDGDKPMAPGIEIGLLERIVADQRRIIADVTGRPASAVPQMWALYKEVQAYFDAGMRVPDDVTLLFSDDNWGNLRRLPPAASRAGGYGIYYHLDYVGGPRNYKWVGSTQVERVWEELRLAYAHGVRQLWIANVGDLKPLELPVSFFLELAWNPEAMPLERLATYTAHWAGRQFGAEHAREAGELLSRYTQYNARRKPELLVPGTYSFEHFDEAARIRTEWNDLAARARRLGKQLGPGHRDAWYELIGYPILASANLDQLYHAVARNRLHAAQGRASAADDARLAQRAFARDARLASAYERKLAGGKWPHMAAQTHIGYTGWQQPPVNVMPATVVPTVPSIAALGVAIEGNRGAWPGTAAAPVLPPLDWLGARSRHVVVFARGTARVRFSARASAPWLRVTPDAGLVGPDQTLAIDADWPRVPTGRNDAWIDLRGGDGSSVRVALTVLRPANADAAHGFVESEGRVVIEAEHFAHAVAAPGLTWQTVPRLGRTLSAVILRAPTAARPVGILGHPHLDYAVWLRAPGTFDIHVVLSPVLDLLHHGGTRLAVSFDAQPPQTLTVVADSSPGSAGFAAWESSVKDSVYVAIARATVATAGAHMLKLWPRDPGLVFQRVEITRDALPTSYLGPPESRRH